MAGTRTIITATRYHDFSAGHRSAVPQSIKRIVKSVISGSGVYALQCVKTGKSYVGSSRCVPNRISEHFNNLRKGAHPNRILQKAWDTYLEKNFAVVVLARCKSKKQRLEEEQIFIECMGEYNGTPFAVPGRRPRTLQEREHLSQVLSGVSKLTKGKTYRQIYGTSTPTCGYQRGGANIACRQDIRKKLSEHTKKMWETGRLKGHRQSAETKQKMSVARTKFWSKQRAIKHTSHS